MKQNKVKIAVVTVNYNNAKDTSECIRSFYKLDTSGLEISIIMVNNGSTEKESQNLKEKFPEIIFINSSVNKGFAGGNNLGIKKATENKADYILLINNDATVQNKDFFQNLLKSKEEIISPLIIFKKNGKTTYDFGGKVDWLFGRNTHINSSNKKYDGNTKPDYISGACLFIKAIVFRKIRLLDDKYFLYYEDVDFCLRAKKAGFKLGINSKSQIFHHLSSSASKLGKRKIKILADSHLRFCMRHLPIISAPFYLSFNLYLRLKTFLP